MSQNLSRIKRQVYGLPTKTSLAQRPYAQHKASIKNGQRSQFDLVGPMVRRSRDPKKTRIFEHAERVLTT